MGGVGEGLLIHFPQGNSEIKQAGMLVIWGQGADLGPEFQETGMIEWGQKLKPPKIPRASKNPPQKSLDQN